MRLLTQSVCPVVVHGQLPAAVAAAAIAAKQPLTARSMTGAPYGYRWEKNKTHPFWKCSIKQNARVCVLRTV